MAKLGRREWLISTLGAVTACQGRRDPYAPPAQDNLAKPTAPAALAQVRTICGACPAACGIDVRVCEGRALSIAGNLKAPFNKGRLCPLGLAGIEGLYHPRRLTGPMRRTGPRGQANFQPIAWEEAMTWLLERMAKLRVEETPERLVLLEGQSSFTTSLLWSRFMAAFGSPNHLPMGPFSTLASARAEEEATGVASVPMEALHHATYVLAVGESSLELGPSWLPLVTSLSRPYRPFLGCASPRTPLSGPTPDEFFPIRPGSAGLFQLALAQVLVRKGGEPQPLIPPEFLVRYAPDRVAHQIGLPAGTIELLAQRLANEKSVVVLLDATLQDESFARASTLLRHCLGKRTWSQNPDLPVFPHWPEFAGDRIGRTGASMPRLDWPSDRSKSQDGRSNIVEALVSEYPYKASIILLSGECVGISPKALAGADSVVSFSSYLTETSLSADLLLPNHHFLETWDISPMGRDVRFLGQCRPVVPPSQHSRPTGDVIVGLAKGLGEALAQAMPWVSHEAAVRSLFSSEIISGLEATGTWTVVPDEACFPPHGTPISRSLRPKLSWKFPDTPLPTTDASYSFLLIPARGWGDLMPDLKWVEEIPFAPGNPYVSRLEIHPADAFRLGIKNGETVQVETPNFQVIASAYVRSGLRPGVLAMNRRPMRFDVCQARVRPSS